MINWLSIIFTEWLMVIYYFHTFSYTNIRNSYNDVFLDKIYFYFYRLTRGAKAIHPLKIFNTWLKTALQCSHKGTCLSLS